MGYYLKSGRHITGLKSLDVSNSKGNLQKWTAVLDGSLVYIKTNSHIRNLDCYECEAECVASRLGVLLGLKPVIYHLDELVYDDVKYKVCYSIDFKGTSYFKTYNELALDIASKHGIGKYNSVIAVAPKAMAQIDSVLIFDAIIGNDDRHLRNLGLLINGTIQQVPIFDNGNSLFYNKSIESIRLALKASPNFQRCKPFYHTIGDQLKLVDFTSIYLKLVSKVNVYRLVNLFYNGERAKLLCKYLCNQLKGFNLLWEK